MHRLRPILGIVVAVIMILSSAAHSFKGWPLIRGELVAANAPADLVTGLGIAWHFMGGAMLVFGVILLDLFLQRRRGLDASLVPARAISVLYIVSGAWAYAITANFFFIAMFMIPGLLLGLAAFGREPVVVQKPEDSI